MQTINLTAIGDEFVFHYGGQLNQINADTLANSLLDFSEAFKEINRVVNPEFEIEIYVDALGGGSFRARIKTVNKRISTLFEGIPKTIIVGLFTAFLYDKIFTDQIQVIVNDDHYLVQNKEQQIILPIEAYEYKEKIAENTEVERRVSKAFKALNADANVTEFGIAKNLDDNAPLVTFPRENFFILSEIREAIVPEERQRTKEEKANLLIIRAIFERGNRKWEFVWKEGVKFSAPILDHEFYDKLVSHEYVIGIGDTLQVIVRIHQAKEEISNIWINESYEILKVLGHTPGPHQKKMF
jgi:hypothetical protein